VESPVLGNGHAGFGRRPGETGWSQGQHRAPGRPYKLFDKGVLGLDDQHRVSVSAHFIGRSPSAQTVVLDLLGRAVLAPQPGFDLPDTTHIGWHRQQVFQQPARQSASR
jgi:hypothetical protein